MHLFYLWMFGWMAKHVAQSRLISFAVSKEQDEEEQIFDGLRISLISIPLNDGHFSSTCIHSQSGINVKDPGNTSCGGIWFSVTHLVPTVLRIPANVWIIWSTSCSSVKCIVGVTHLIWYNSWWRGFWIPFLVKLQQQFIWWGLH